MRSGACGVEPSSACGDRRGMQGQRRQFWLAMGGTTSIVQLHPSPRTTSIHDTEGVCMYYIYKHSNNIYVYIYIYIILVLDIFICKGIHMYRYVYTYIYK